MTHLLSKITIKNFKSIKDASFELNSFTPLVGYNNAGKSNLLSAIKWLLRKSSLSESAFYDVSAPVEIEGEISGITQEILNGLANNHRSSIEPFLNTNTIRVKRIQQSPNLGTTNIKLYVENQTNNEWGANPTGLDQALQALFPEPIEIGAMENSEEDVSKNKNTTTIGKLLAEVIESIQQSHGGSFLTAINEIKQVFDVNGVSRSTELNDFDSSVNNKINDFFPGISIKVHVPTPDLKDILSKGTIKVFEGTILNGRDVSEFGHGTQRSIQMALVRHLADTKRNSGMMVANTILLIDEPELYLHPQAIEVLRNALKTLSTNGYQVIFSTHSPFMITSKDIGNTLLIRKSAEIGTHKRNSLRSAIMLVESEYRSQLELIFSLSHSSHILFSEKVILAEGTTENRVIPSIIEKVTQKTIGLHKAALVSMGGSGNTRKTIEVLKVMDIPTKAVVDLDYALLHGEKEMFLSEGDLDVSTIKAHLNNIAPLHQITLHDNGWPKSKSSIVSAAEAFRILAKESNIQKNIQNIKEKFLDKNIYIWVKGTIEDHLGDIPKNEAGWAEFNNKIEELSLSEVLPNDYNEIETFVNWLIQE
jgi:putative ATP-dependent endonuclease of OLD family